MARDFSVNDLVNRVRLLNDYLTVDGTYDGDAPRAPSSGTIITWLDVGNSYAWNVYAHSDENWSAVRYTFTTVVNSASYALPSDFYIARNVEQAVDSSTSPAGWRPLRRADVDDDSDSGTTQPGGSTVAYRYLGDWIELVPPPGDARQIRITYTPTAQVLSSSLQTIDGVDGYEQVVVLKACILARIREGQPYADLESQLGEHLEQMQRNVRRRDRGTPYHTRDRRDALGYWPPRRYGR